MMNNSSSKDERKSRIWKKLKSEARWLLPGTGFKRWILLTILGSMLRSCLRCSSSATIARRQPHRGSHPGVFTLADRPLACSRRIAALIVIGIWGANRSLLKPERLDAR